MPISSLVVLVLAPVLFCTAMAFFPGSAVTWHRPWPPRGTRWLPTEPVRRPLGRGFSLLELIVVLVVLGLLAAIAIPSYERLIGRTSQATVEATAESLGRNLQALAALDQTNPWTVDVDAAIAEMSGDYTFDSSSYISDGIVVVTRDTACATLTMGASLASPPSVAACDAPPTSVPPLTAVQSLVDLLVETSPYLVHPAPYLPSGVTWTEATLAELEAMTAPMDLSDRVLFIFNTDTGSGDPAVAFVEFFFLDSPSSCSYWSLASPFGGDPYLLLQFSMPTVAPGTCPGFWDWTSNDWQQLEWVAGSWETRSSYP